MYVIKIAINSIIAMLFISYNNDFIIISSNFLAIVVDLRGLQCEKQFVNLEGFILPLYTSILFAVWKGTRSLLSL